MKHARLWAAPAVVLVCFIAVMLLGLVRPSLHTTMFTIGLYALIALPLGLIYGQGGTISLAQGSFAAIGAYTSAILTTRYGVPVALSVIPAMLLPAAVAFVIARPILRLPELSLALVTLSVGTVVAVGLQRGGDFTGSYVGISGAPPLPIMGKDPVLVAIALWSTVLVLVILYTHFVHSARGRATNAIRVDRLLAEAMGVNVPLDLATLFAIAAAIAGLAGWFYVHYIGYIAPDSLSTDMSANILFMVVLGGRRSVLGPILGAAFFTFANDFLPGTETQGLFFGIILVLILLLSPDGILSPQAMRWVQRLFRRGTTAPRSAKAASAAPIPETGKVAQ
jgi:branched-chain amino acid transport system permease protein